MNKPLMVIVSMLGGAAIAAVGVYVLREPLVRSALVGNPQILSEAAEAFQAQQQGQKLEQVAAEIAKPFPGAVGGNPTGKVTLVKFTDYACGYCRASVPEMEKLTAANPDLRIIYREMPILSAESRDAALWALAAAKQGKHAAFHKAMFAAGQPGEGSIMMAAEKAGLDITAALSFSKSQEAAAEVERNLQFQQQLGSIGTPTYVVAGKMLQGLQSQDALQELIDKARSDAAAG